MFITHTVAAWSKEGHFFLNHPILLAEIHADTVLYSPDTLKIFSTVVFRFSGTSGYSGTTVIGYREQRDSPWILYEYGGGGAADSYTLCSEITRWAFSDNRKGTGFSEYIVHYGMYEEGFWTDLLFQKGKDIDSLYYFQLDFGKDNQHNVIRPYYKVNYPDSLLRMYNKLP